jgi:hypothetical protein
VKRLLVATLIFLGSVFLFLGALLAPALVREYRRGFAGFSIVLGSPAENLVRILVLLVLGLLAYGLSGKFAKA